MPSAFAGGRRRPRRADRRASGRRRTCSRPPTSPRCSACSEGDVLAILDSGDLKGKKIGADLPRSRAPRSTSTSRNDRGIRGIAGYGRGVRGKRGIRVADPEYRSPQNSRSQQHSRNTPARPAARRPSGIRRSSCSSARSAAPSRRIRSRPTAQIEELDLVAALRELPEDQRGWQTETRARSSARAARRSRCSTPSGSASAASSAARRRSSTTRRSRRRSGRRVCCRSRSPRPQVREQIRSAGTGKWFAPNASSTRADRHRARRLHPVLDVRRAGRLPTGRPTRVTTTTRPKPTATARAARRRARCGTCAGCPRRARRSFLRRRAGAGHDGRRRTDCCAKSSRSRRNGARAVRHRLPLRLGRRALPDRPARRRRQASRDQMDAQAARALRARRCPATRTATSRFSPTYSAQTFKHILVPVWLLTYTYGARCSRSSSTAHRPDRRRVPEELLEDRVPRARDYYRGAGCSTARRRAVEQPSGKGHRATGLEVASLSGIGLRVPFGPKPDWRSEPQGR